MVLTVGAIFGITTLAFAGWGRGYGHMMEPGGWGSDRHQNWVDMGMALVEDTIVRGKLPALYRHFDMSIEECNMTYKFRLQRGLTWSVAILALSNIYSIPALAQSGRYSNWHMGRWMMGDEGMGWIGMIFMIFFWGLIIVGLVFLVRWLIQTTSSRGHSGVSAGSKAMDILKERYARGEITRDEFESMKKVIIQ